jgi:hypothetical protein
MPEALQAEGAAAVQGHVGSVALGQAGSLQAGSNSTQQQETRKLETASHSYRHVGCV